MLVTYELHKNTPLSERQKHMLDEMQRQPVVFDEDARELTREEIARFYQVAEQRREERRKQNVTLRLSPGALNTAKSLGKGYTSVLARILEDVLSDRTLIEKYL